jgi:uncharacterized Ntn-hydrolase superfamily protein
MERHRQAAVYRNFDWEGPLQFVRKAADLSERVMPRTARPPGDKAIQQWYAAGLHVVRDVSWPIVDLRVDWADDDPIAELTALWERFEPQVEDYVRRALDPAAAPSFGVPGDR